jgi:hypothetical protein
MKLAKADLVRMLHSQGDNATAGKVEAAALPDEIDTDRDGEVLAAAGLGHERLMAKLAAGGMPRIIG